MPSRPTSASSRSSSRRLRASPGQPGVFCRGARLVLLLKCRLPKPPSPPLASSTRSPGTSSSAITSSLSWSVTIVPTGMRSTMSGAAAPHWSDPRPGSPLRASWRRAERKSIKVFRPRSATANTLPPRPPSPPSGPPNGMNFSRRKLTQPAPPFPAATSIVASSTNFICADDKKPRQAGAVSHGACGAPGSGRRDRDRPMVARAFDGERYRAVDEREQGVVAADADVPAGVELGTALAHDDRAGTDRLPAEDLDAEHLGLRIAAIAGRAAALFLCHLDNPFSRRSRRSAVRYNPGGGRRACGNACAAAS